MIFKNYSFFIFFVLLLTFKGLTQNETYKFNHITDVEGLSQNSVLAMHQDKLGQMWIGTRNGLNKYDGEEFKIYKHQKGNKNSISNNAILSIEEDSDGYIWLGTSFGLNRYNPKKNNFKNYFFNKGKVYSRNNIITVVKKTSKEELWVGTANGGAIYNKKTDKFKSFLENRNITSILEIKSGAIFIGTRKGLLKVVSRHNNNFKFKKISGTENEYIQDIIESPTGNILIATKNKSVLELDVFLEKVTPYFNEKTLSGKNRNIRKLLFDQKGSLWMASYNGLQISENKNSILVLYRNNNYSKSINDNYIKTIFKDNTDAVWVGTYYGGINIYSEFNKNFVNITQRYFKSGLNLKVVSSLANYKDFLILGTDGGGISILNEKTGEAQQITTKNYPSLKNNNIKSLYVTNNGLLWIGLFGSGVSLYNMKTSKFESLPFPKKLKKHIKNTGVLSVVQYNNDIILFGTNSKGLIKYNTKTNQYSIFNRNKSSNSLTSNDIKTIYNDSKGNIWVGTLRGLNCISKNDKVSKYIYRKDLNVKFEISSIREDTNGDLWIGTDEDGLFKFHNNTFYPIEININGLHIMSIRSIVNAEKNKFWISTFTEGIFKFNTITNKVEAYYSTKEGLISNQYIRNASLKVADSRYFFGGPAGLTYFDENRLVKNTHTPQVIITDFKIKNNSIPVTTNGFLENAVSYTNNIKLSHNQGNFSLSFAIPNFINSSSNSYKYRLKGVDKDWTETSNNKASYTIQNSGTYIFEVKGINSDGFINDYPTKLSIYVAPAPWLTWWAYSLYAMLIMFGLYYLYYVLKSKTKLKHQLELEHIKSEQIKKVNKSKLEFFTNISHEFRTPLTLILGSTQQILEEYSRSNKLFKKLKVVENNSNHLLKLINRLMDFRKYENELMKLEASEGNIVKFLKEIFLSFSEYAKEEKYEYNFLSSSDDIRLFYDRDKLERMFFNLISNAFKYTLPKGEINIEIKEEKNKVVIMVSDTGFGIPDEYKNKIFDRFFEISKRQLNNNKVSGTGIGLAIVKNIIQMHKGTIKVIDNNNSNGSVFIVELLKGKTHLKNKEIVDNLKFSEDISTYEKQLFNIQKQDKASFIKEIPSEEKKSILLVEDNKELRVFIKKILIQDYNIYEASNGEEAYKTTIKEKVDLIISDVVMPIKTGIELCKLIKRDIRTSHIPIILLTTRSELVYKLEGLEYGADDYISKPFNIKELKLRIANILVSIQKIKENNNIKENLVPDNFFASSLDEELYKKALKVIKENLSNESFNINYFCSEIGVSKSVLYVKIKAWTDFTPKQFILHFRLKFAADLLEQGKFTISKISNKVGFKDQKYFARVFKKEFGKTPTDYANSFYDSNPD